MLKKHHFHRLLMVYWSFAYDQRSSCTGTCLDKRKQSNCLLVLATPLDQGYATDSSKLGIAVALKCHKESAQVNRTWPFKAHVSARGPNRVNKTLEKNIEDPVCALVVERLPSAFVKSDNSYTTAARTRKVVMRE